MSPEEVLNKCEKDNDATLGKLVRDKYNWVHPGPK